MTAGGDGSRVLWDCGQVRWSLWDSVFFSKTAGWILGQKACDVSLPRPDIPRHDFLLLREAFSLRKLQNTRQRSFQTATASRVDVPLPSLRDLRGGKGHSAALAPETNQDVTVQEGRWTVPLSASGGWRDRPFHGCLDPRGEGGQVGLQWQPSCRLQPRRGLRSFRKRARGGLR